MTSMRALTFTLHINDDSKHADIIFTISASTLLYFTILKLNRSSIRWPSQIILHREHSNFKRTLLHFCTNLTGQSNGGFLRKIIWFNNLSTTLCSFKWSRRTTTLRCLRENQFRFQSINLHNGIFDKFFFSFLDYNISHFNIIFSRLLSPEIQIPRICQNSDMISFFVRRVVTKFLENFEEYFIVRSATIRCGISENHLSGVECYWNHFVNSWNHKCHSAKQSVSRKCS